MTSAARLRRRRAHVRRLRTADPTDSLAVCWRSGAGKGTHVGILHPNGSEFVVAWLAAARIGAVSVPFSTFSTPRRAGRRCFATPTSICCSSASSVSLARLRRSHWARRFPSSTSGPHRRCSPSRRPSLRRVAFDRPTIRGVGSQWTTTQLVAAGSVIDDEVLAAVEDDGRAGRPDGDRAHLGIDRARPRV